jgi:Thrombospondin type 1 domain
LVKKHRLIMVLATIGLFKFLIKVSIALRVLIQFSLYFEIISRLISRTFRPIGAFRENLRMKLFLSQKFLLQTLFLLAFSFLFANSAYADCSTTSPPTCSYVSKTATSSITPSAFDHPTPVCKQVTNNCSTDIMVPTVSQSEWSSFVNNHESCAALADCTAYSWSIGGWGDCSVTCGGGTQTRTVVCSALDTTTELSLGPVDGSICTALFGSAPTSQVCDTMSCAPPIVTLVASNTNVTPGTTVQLTWTVTGTATSCTASGDPSFSGSISTSGGFRFVTVNATTTYTVTCNSDGGPGSANATVTVAGAPGVCPAINFVGDGNATWSQLTNCTGGATYEYYGPGPSPIECVPVGSFRNLPRQASEGGGILPAWSGLSYPPAADYTGPVLSVEGGVGFSVDQSSLFPYTTIYDADHDAQIVNNPYWPTQTTQPYAAGSNWWNSVADYPTYYQPNDAALLYTPVAGNPVRDLYFAVTNAIAAPVRALHGIYLEPTCDYAPDDLVYSSCLGFMQANPGGHGELVTSGAYPGGDQWSFQITGTAPGGGCFVDAGGGVGQCHVHVTYTRPYASSDCGAEPNPPFCAVYPPQYSDTAYTCTLLSSSPQSPNTLTTEGPQNCSFNCVKTGCILGLCD